VTYATDSEMAAAIADLERRIALAGSDGRRRRILTPSAISRMEEMVLWLRWLEVEDAKLFSARADRTPWKPICWQFGIARATANRQYGLNVIVWRVNGRRVPAKRSGNFVVERARLGRLKMLRVEPRIPK
jgi:hypothetical protein